MGERGESASSNIRACAACRHQRSRCRPGCILAPYFPAQRTAQFNAVHRLFGVRNLLWLYNNAPSEHRDHAMKSLTYEALAWRYHPVHGCLGVIYDLYVKIDATSRELDATSLLLASYRRQQEEEQQQMMMMPPPPLAPMPELHADSFPQQQQLAPLSPPLLPTILMNLDDDRGVNIGRMNERGGSSHGWRLSDEEAMRAFNPAAELLNPAADLPGMSMLVNTNFLMDGE
uniref:LOB domain-containing protein 21-like n=1 Tax=Elaeis guineensis var. tenera TaxID=51953 RepID=A0A8N4EQW8_ELAGV|nr:LOB domain-containing protein 21-like [Elaeis guineensis]